MRSKKRLTKEEQDQLDYKEIWEYKPGFTKQVIYVTFICGLLLICIGLYLSISGSFAAGETLPGKAGGGGQFQVVSGPGILIIGLLVFMIAIKDIINWKKAVKGKK